MSLQFEALTLAQPVPAKEPRRTLLDLAGVEEPTTAFKKSVLRVKDLWEEFNFTQRLSPPKIGAAVLEPYKGTCKQLVEEVTQTVQDTLSRLDYSSFPAYLKFTEQLEGGVPLSEIAISSSGEEPASACVGLTLLLQKALKEKHQINSSLALCRQFRLEPFSHAALVVECSDGKVLINSDRTDSDLLFPVPYNTTAHFKKYAITASNRGQNPALIAHAYATKKQPSYSLEFFTHVSNVEAIVMKNYILHGSRNFIPLVAHKNGKPFKVINLFVKDGKVVFKDLVLKGEVAFPLTECERDGFISQLREFMGSDFHVSPETVHAQLLKLISQRERIQSIFNSAKKPPPVSDLRKFFAEQIR